LRQQEYSKISKLKKVGRNSKLLVTLVLARGLDRRHARELGFPIRAAAVDGLALLGYQNPLARVRLVRSLEHRNALGFEGSLVGRELGLFSIYQLSIGSTRIIPPTRWVIVIGGLLS
jgi:hypothetical protein